MHPLQKIINDHNVAQSKLSGEEFNLGDLIKILETAPQDMSVDVVLSDGTIMLPYSKDVCVCIDGDDDNWEDSNFTSIVSCLDSWRGSYLNLAIYVRTDYTNYKVKDMLQQAKDTLGKYLQGYKGGAFLMGLGTPIYLAREQSDYLYEKVIDVKIDNDMFRVHLICRDSSND